MTKYYVCPRCGYKTNNITNIKSHLNRKRVCKPKLKNINLDDQILYILEGVKVPKEFEHRSYKNKILKEENERLREENERLKNKPTTVINNVNNVNNDNRVVNVNITLPHRDSNYEFLTDKDYIHCINRMIMSVPNLIRRIHFNPAHPENHNICIKNLRNKLVMEYDGKQWNICGEDKAIDKLITDHEYILEEWLENGEDKYPKQMDKFEKYLKLKEDDKVVNDIKEEIKHLLYNNRNMIATK
jgi:hypothetical protein